LFEVRRLKRFGDRTAGSRRSGLVYTDDGDATMHAVVG